MKIWNSFGKSLMNIVDGIEPTCQNLFLLNVALRY